MSINRRLMVGLVTAWCLASPAPATAQPQACWPLLSVKQPRLSDAMINLKRYWSATLEVNAAFCIELAGTFDLRTVRTKEIGPDFAVTEPVAWSTRQTDVVLELWADEAVLDYRIGRVRPCTCRF